jgi:glycosyltransferase involved in cell wall biosynthesis
LNYLPNVDGALWFAESVLPRVRRAVPDVRFDLVGRSPVDDVRRLASHPAIEVHADVPAVAPFLERARVAVVPLRMGTGTRLKALEALAAARPVVGTTIGLEGLGIRDGVDARIVDDAEQMATAIVELLTSDAAALRIAEAGAELARSSYGWARIGAAMCDELIRLVTHDTD